MPFGGSLGRSCTENERSLAIDGSGEPTGKYAASDTTFRQEILSSLLSWQSTHRHHIFTCSICLKLVMSAPPALPKRAAAGVGAPPLPPQDSAHTLDVPAASAPTMNQRRSLVLPTPPADGAGPKKVGLPGMMKAAPKQPLPAFGNSVDDTHAASTDRPEQVQVRRPSQSVSVGSGPKKFAPLPVPGQMPVQPVKQAPQIPKYDAPSPPPSSNSEFSHTNPFGAHATNNTTVGDHDTHGDFGMAHVAPVARTPSPQPPYAAQTAPVLPMRAPQGPPQGPSQLSQRGPVSTPSGGVPPSLPAHNNAPLQAYGYGAPPTLPPSNAGPPPMLRPSNVAHYGAAPQLPPSTSSNSNAFGAAPPTLPSRAGEVSRGAAPPLPPAQASSGPPPLPSHSLSPPLPGYNSAPPALPSHAAAGLPPALPAHHGAPPTLPPHSGAPPALPSHGSGPPPLPSHSDYGAPPLPGYNTGTPALPNRAGAPPALPPQHAGPPPSLPPSNAYNASTPVGYNSAPAPQGYYSAPPPAYQQAYSAPPAYQQAYSGSAATPSYQQPYAGSAPSTQLPNHGPSPQSGRVAGGYSHGAAPPLPSPSAQTQADLRTEASARASEYGAQVQTHAQREAGAAAGRAAEDRDNQKAAGEALAARSDNRLVQGLARNSFVQKQAGKQASKAANDEKNQQAVGDAVVSGAKSGAQQGYSQASKPSSSPGSKFPSGF